MIGRLGLRRPLWQPEGMADSFAARFAAIRARYGPLVWGLDPSGALLEAWGFGDSAAGLDRFADVVLDTAAGTVGLVKPQSAFYERHGWRGIRTLQRLLVGARRAGLLTILDVKRGDVGSTNDAYARAFLGQAEIEDGAGDAVGGVRRAPGPPAAAGRGQVDQDGLGGHGQAVHGVAVGQGTDTDMRDVPQAAGRRAIEAQGAGDVLAVGPRLHQPGRDRRRGAHGWSVPGQARGRVAPGVAGHEGLAGVPVPAEQLRGAEVAMLRSDPVREVVARRGQGRGQAAEPVLAGQVAGAVPADRAEAQLRRRAEPAARLDRADPDGKDLASSPGTPGEAVYRSPSMMSGYYRDEPATRAAFRFGWFHSGDSCVYDADGLREMLDRYKDIVKTGGENVSSLRVEAVLGLHPGVAKSAVIGLPHPYWGEAVTAVVIRAPGDTTSEADLIAFCRASLGGYETPKSVVFAESLPETVGGKVLKYKLRVSYADHYESAEAAP
jgi:hypothetical protein